MRVELFQKLIQLPLHVAVILFLLLTLLFFPLSPPASKHARLVIRFELVHAGLFETRVALLKVVPHE